MIKTNFIIFVYLLCFALFPLRAEIIKKIEIVGNSRISDETIKVYGKVKEPNSNYSKDELDNILKDLYSTNFFENVSLEVRDKTLIIKLDEYPVVSQLLIIGEKSNKFNQTAVFTSSGNIPNGTTAAVLRPRIPGESPL